MSARPERGRTCASMPSSIRGPAQWGPTPRPRGQSRAAPRPARRPRGPCPPRRRGIFGQRQVHAMRQADHRARQGASRSSVILGCKAARAAGRVGHGPGLGPGAGGVGGRARPLQGRTGAGGIPPPSPAPLPQGGRELSARKAGLRLEPPESPPPLRGSGWEGGRTAAARAPLPPPPQKDSGHAHVEQSWMWMAPTGRPSSTTMRAVIFAVLSAAGLRRPSGPAGWSSGYGS